MCLRVTPRIKASYRVETVMPRKKLPPAVPERLLSMREVMALIPYSRPSIYRLVAANRFPAPLKIGDNKIAWRESDVLAWQTSRTAA